MPEMMERLPQGSASLNNHMLAVHLTSCTITPEDPIQVSQIQHRLDLLCRWFGNLQSAKAVLTGRTLVEIGCGQGDMTATLAYMVSGPDSKQPSAGKVFAVDPAALTYGAPHTLGDAQDALSRSSIGKHIQWIQQDPLDVLGEQCVNKQIDFIVLAHSLFYLPSADYFSRLLRACKAATASGTKLMLAEWGMRRSTTEAEAHVLAVKVQMEQPRPDANIRTVLSPQRIKVLAEQADWCVENEQWIDQPDLHDGEWEVANVRKWLIVEEMNEKAKELFSDMEEAIRQNDGVVKCMDVWAAVLA